MILETPPATDEEFFNLYISDLRRLFRHYSLQDWEDRMAEFCVRWIEVGYLDRFDGGSFRQYVLGLIKSHAKGSARRNSTVERSTTTKIYSLYTPVGNSSVLLDLVAAKYISSDPLDVFIRQEEMTEAKSQVDSLMRRLSQIPATDYSRGKASLVPASERKSLGDVLRAFADDFWTHEERLYSPRDQYTSLRDRRSDKSAPRDYDGAARIGRQRDVLASKLSVSPNTARSWQIKMIEKCKEQYV